MKNMLNSVNFVNRNFACSRPSQVKFKATTPEKSEVKSYSATGKNLEKAARALNTMSSADACMVTTEILQQDNSRETVHRMLKLADKSKDLE